MNTEHTGRESHSGLRGLFYNLSFCFFIHITFVSICCIFFIFFHCCFILCPILFIYLWKKNYFDHFHILSRANNWPFNQPTNEPIDQPTDGMFFCHCNLLVGFAFISFNDSFSYYCVWRIILGGGWGSECDGVTMRRREKTYTKNVYTAIGQYDEKQTRTVEMKVDRGTGNGMCKH